MYCVLWSWCVLGIPGLVCVKYYGVGVFCVKWGWYVISMQGLVCFVYDEVGVCLKLV